ncbi:MAG TPA: hypothetical protein VM598_11920 [Bdellovibrionota bacterium]|nr:hypothetical protein [Bdellovibrionota bacterium]
MRILIAIAFLASPAAHAVSPDADYLLAARYAPMIFQHTGSHPKADAITNVDFDGDWSSNNNWDNLDRFEVPAFVYYSVIETESHYFITYAFFHPRDYAWLCFPWICHENDLEGAGLTVEKTAAGPGDVVYLETKAHTSMDRTRDVPHIGGKTALYVERGGHGVHPWKPVTKGKFFTYSYAGRADDPGEASEGAFGYELLPIETTIWAQRNSIGKGQTYRNTYDYTGTRFSLGPVPNKFAGEKWAANVVTAPWSWSDGGVGGLKLGDWFFDPALAVSRRVTLSKPISLEYVHNPYIGVYR